MDVADEGEEVGIFVAKNGFIPVLEKVAGAAVATIKVLGIPGEELSHDGGDAVLATLKEDVNVIVHENLGKDRAPGFGNVLAEPFEEFALVLVVIKYLGLVDPSHHDMVQGAGNV